MFGVAYMLVLYSYFNKSRNDFAYCFSLIKLVSNLSVLCFLIKSYKAYVSVIYVINEERFFSKAKKRRFRSYGRNYIYVTMLYHNIA